MIDLDGNGLINGEELKIAFQAQLDDEEQDTIWQQVIAEVDKNGDGVISPEEFRQMMEEVMKKEVMVSVTEEQLNDDQ